MTGQEMEQGKARNGEQLSGPDTSGVRDVFGTLVDALTAAGLWSGTLGRLTDEAARQTAHEHLTCEIERAAAAARSLRRLLR